jgi:hypothetical protein
MAGMAGGGIRDAAGEALAITVGGTVIMAEAGGGIAGGDGILAGIADGGGIMAGMGGGIMVGAAGKSRSRHLPLKSPRASLRRDSSHRRSGRKGTYKDGGRAVTQPLAADESQEVLVNHVGVGREHAVRKQG